MGYLNHVQWTQPIGESLLDEKKFIQESKQLKDTHDVKIEFGAYTTNQSSMGHEEEKFDMMVHLCMYVFFYKRQMQVFQK